LAQRWSLFLRESPHLARIEIYDLEEAVTRGGPTQNLFEMEKDLIP